ncbi:MAG TPA: hypothetical protein VMM36_19965 [Opitutaceae bacterium]|nr:hypothetical protein [Opitutaceae bacterium]
MKNDKDILYTPAELFTEMQALVAEAQAMMADTVSEHAADGLEALRVRFAAVQERFTEAYAQGRKRVIAGAKCTDEAIRANPYQALAIAAGVSLLIGVLVGRRTR